MLILNKWFLLDELPCTVFVLIRKLLNMSFLPLLHVSLVLNFTKKFRAAFRQITFHTKNFRFKNIAYIEFCTKGSLQDESKNRHLGKNKGDKLNVR